MNEIAERHDKKHRACVMDLVHVCHEQGNGNVNGEIHGKRLVCLCGKQINCGYRADDMRSHGLVHKHGRYSEQNYYKSNDPWV